MIPSWGCSPLAVRVLDAGAEDVDALVLGDDAARLGEGVRLLDEVGAVGFEGAHGLDPRGVVRARQIAARVLAVVARGESPAAVAVVDLVDVRRPVAALALLRAAERGRARLAAELPGDEVGAARLVLTGQARIAPGALAPALFAVVVPIVARCGRSGVVVVFAALVLVVVAAVVVAAVVLIGLGGRAVGFGLGGGFGGGAAEGQEEGSGDPWGSGHVAVDRISLRARPSFADGGLANMRIR